MFGFGKKTMKVSTPLAGKIVDITEVPDEVFSEKILGDGFAVIPAADAGNVVSPCDGKISMLAETNHALAITADGVELLLHIGLDTVELGGKGFTALVKEGAVIKKGMPLLAVDWQVLAAAGKNPVTMLVISNADEVSLKKKNLQNAEVVLEIECK